ncbi:hypothetical protein BpHYR1_010861 [Brachionus plicatilis]|uniref:Uncharacterized protein n=1 Tax=Brachionus plicatilis TaxID=10195 RepID=A0A3M7RVC9_BRAPC|nr:hypothetical protein BpHYR1_010861 [Brachionus plicatilis]
MNFRQEILMKISELIKKLTLKGEKASEIRKKAIEINCSKFWDVSSKTMPSIKKPLYIGYFNQIEISKGFRSAREIALESEEFSRISLACQLFVIIEKYEHCKKSKDCSNKALLHIFHGFLHSTFLIEIFIKNKHTLMFMCNLIPINQAKIS